MKVILLMAVTADGMIARRADHVIDWTGKADKKYFVHVTKKAGAMIMGSKTFDMIGSVLSGRKNIVMTRDKTRKSSHKNLIFTDRLPELILKDLHSHGYQSAVVIGGSIINTLFLRENLIDEIHLTIVPKLFGTGIALFNKSLNTQLELIESQELEKGHILLKYKVDNHTGTRAAKSRRT